MTSPTREQILRDLSGILRDFNGKEYSGDIESDTLFFADLGLVSIDAVMLAEKLEQFYERQFPFNQFLAEVGREGARDIKLARIVAFLYDQMYAPAREGKPCR